MRKRSIFSVAVIVVALMAVFSPGVAAQSIYVNDASAAGDAELLTDNGNNYHSTGPVYSDNEKPDNGDSQGDPGNSGKGADNPHRFHKFFDAMSRTMERFRNIFRERERHGDDPGFSDNITWSDNTTRPKSDILKERGVHGKGIDEALGQQKPFNPNNGIRRPFISDNITSSDNFTRPKGEILKEYGVPGKGIDTAPGQQKPFNPQSNAPGNKKDKVK